MDGYKNYEQALQGFNKYREILENQIDGAKELFQFMDSKGFTALPASLNHHLNYQGGLLIHSMNVTHALLKMTNELGLKWVRFESPFIVGLLHDLCKLEFYKAKTNYDPREGETVRFEHNDSPEFDLGGHGMLSVVLAQKFIQLTDEEIHCIRFHMGAYGQKDWSKFDSAIGKYPNVLYTHTADMIASKIMER